jgi:hypothetical protein
MRRQLAGIQYQWAAHANVAAHKQLHVTSFSRLTTCRGCCVHLETILWPEHCFTAAASRETTYDEDGFMLQTGLSAT